MYNFNVRFIYLYIKCIRKSGEEMYLNINDFFLLFRMDGDFDFIFF